MSRYRDFCCCLGIILAGSALPLANAKGQANTPRQCLQYVRRADRDIPISEEGGLTNPDSARQLRQAAAGVCLQKFAQVSVPSGQLLPLAEIAAIAQDYAAFRKAVAECISSTTGDSAQGQVFLQAVIMLGKTDGVSRLAVAGEYVHELDSLARKTRNNASARALVQAAEILATRYNTGTQDDSSKKYADASVAAARLISDSTRNAVAKYLLVAYIHQAEIAMTRSDWEMATQILADAQRNLAFYSSAATELGQLRAAYALLGKPAPALQATTWVDSSGYSTQVAWKDHATILAFGAHWCLPCRASYPSLVRLMGEFKHSPLQLVIVTQTYGYFGEKTALTGAQEIALDSSYFLKEHNLPARVAITDVLKMPDEEGRLDPPRAPDEHAYGVSSLPQTILIDRNGIVQAVYLGWNIANEGHIQTALRRILSSAKM